MALNKKKLKRLPINLRKKAIREARNMAGLAKQPQKQRKPRATSAHTQNDFERAEHNAMLAATSQELEKILANCKELADVPYDSTPAELWGMVSKWEMWGVRQAGVCLSGHGLNLLKN